MRNLFRRNNSWKREDSVIIYSPQPTSVESASCSIHEKDMGNWQKPHAFFTKVVKRKTRGWVIMRKSSLLSVLTLIWQHNCNDTAFWWCRNDLPFCQHCDNNENQIWNGFTFCAMCWIISDPFGCVSCWTLIPGNPYRALSRRVLRFGRKNSVLSS